MYEVYAYLWQLWWPLALRARRKRVECFDVVHVLNFHNDSVPSLAWCLGKPTVWGPINHNETVPVWRMTFWPTKFILMYRIKSVIRRMLWQFDPFLRLTATRMNVILAAGPWVDVRLHLKGRSGVVYRSQLGVREDLPIKLQEHVAGPNGIRLICAGRLDWIKGLDLAVGALALLPSDCRLTLIGEGPARGMLENLAREIDVADRVSFVPPIPRDELFAEFRRHDLMIFPSAETAGLAWVEALRCGLPVVAFNGPTEVALAAECLPGITLAASDLDRECNISAFACAISNAFQQSADRRAISCAVVQHYGWSSLAEEILSVYQDLLNEMR